MQEYVTYEAFGAVGDGRTDDMAAIRAAHDYANAHGLPVKTAPDAVYYIGPRATPAVIRTDTDWTTSRFIIDDTETDDYTADVFIVMPEGAWTSLPLPPLKRGQTRVDLAACGIALDRDMYVTVTSDERRQYIRYGANQDSGSPQTDSFILTRDGTILSGINWDYTRLTSVRAIPVEDTPLTVRGGFFTTIANRAESRYTYYGRGISVRRSRVTVEGVSHTVTGEGDHGAPYNGFFSFSHCAYAVLKDCRVTGHRIYRTIGSAGVPVSMGSYDINCYAVIDIRFLGVKQDAILDRSLWGVFGSNFCKQILFDGCVLSRSDAHCGVRGYTIRNSVMGWMGTNTIGFGDMVMENVTCFGRHLVGFREDYGCTWDGDLTLRNVVWIPEPGTCLAPVMFHVRNGGTHDFGYPCTLPHRILIENVTVVDTNVPEGYRGIRLFEDFDPHPAEAEPFPLERPDELIIRNLHTVSGRPPVICDHTALLQDTKITVE
ncbi:MAG: hypothetical protein MJ192_00040 [Clostridia bacterium]|nr:hypothetical protein [Clostridia bacterium]